MAEFFADVTTFTVDSEDPFYAMLPSHPPRTFHSFSGAAWENAQSRLFLGVHYRFDAVDGNRTGTAVGHAAFASTLRPLHGADFDGDGRVGPHDLGAFRDAYMARGWRADFNHDGRIDTADLAAFLKCYGTDCR
jgi:hypothetical protein